MVSLEFLEEKEKCNFHTSQCACNRAVRQRQAAFVGWLLEKRQSKDRQAGRARLGQGWAILPAWGSLFHFVAKIQ